MELITGAEILTFAAVSAPSTADSDWADQCAAAVNEAVTLYLDWPEPEPQTAADSPEVKTDALLAGAELYRRRDAPFGMTGFVDVNTGGLVRMARDYLEGVKPALFRHKRVSGLVA